MKLFLTLLSLVIIYKGVMDTGDPSGFYSSTAVFYAMLLLDYYSQARNYKSGFIKLARAIMMSLAGISIMGVLNVLSIKEINNEYYITFSESMRLGTDGIINVHWVMFILAIVSVIMTSLEYVYRIDAESNTNTFPNKMSKKGA
ncbi:hypothetical protein [Neobacillus mesonae]|uniref:hypothetical protein n=1 Tax=Neobacillus mesonae TaxID=1193713 RepID=UPI002572AA35|nr:hypothetical protein [Neobacillus mesonae]